MAPNEQEPYGFVWVALCLAALTGCFGWTVMPMFRSRTIGKPGPYAANGFGADYASAITSRRGSRRARRRSAQRSISWKRARNSMALSARSTFGPPSTPDTSNSISPMSTGVQSKSDRMVGARLGRRRSASAGPRGCYRAGSGARWFD
jgi:hypothetical protein